MMGPHSTPPTWMLDVGKQTGQFFDAVYDVYGNKSYRFKNIEQYSAQHGTQEQPSKRYFNADTLPEIINTYPMAKKDAKASDVERGASQKVVCSSERNVG